jgi:hypothetical protein
MAVISLTKPNPFDYVNAPGGDEARIDSRIKGRTILFPEECSTRLAQLFDEAIQLEPIKELSIPH